MTEEQEKQLAKEKLENDQLVERLTSSGYNVLVYELYTTYANQCRPENSDSVIVCHGQKSQEWDMRHNGCRIPLFISLTRIRMPQ